eukprot:TRINITY_DN1333_c0_g1_i2.p1 TRINITY_DN1333_c0_g1~~TRINITY_DN1333_c0_g1_i2.p1  ORF type:complete len:427 (-),score=93.19 TRINITY_DN1333_c0_g1_i2:701-1948(-)
MRFSSMSLLGCLCLLVLLLSGPSRAEEEAVDDDFAVLKSSPIVSPLKAETFASVVSTSSITTVFYYTSDCGKPCQDAAGVFLTAAENLENSVGLRSVDCSDPEQQPLCGYAEITRVPTIQVFGSYGEIEEVEGREAIVKKPVTYEGPIAAPSIVKWTLSHLTNIVVPLDEEGYANYNKMPYTRVFFFSSKKSPSSKLKAMALSLDDRSALLFEGRSFLPFGQASPELGSTSAIKDFGVESYPAMFVVTASGERVQYTGEYKYEDMMEFLTPHAMPMTDELRNSIVNYAKHGQPGEAPPTATAPVAHKLNSIGNQEEYDRVCLSLGTCIILFVDPSDTEGLETLRVLIEDHILKNKKYQSLRFMYVDGVAHQDFKEAFYVADSLPQLVAFKRSKLLLKCPEEGSLGAMSMHLSCSV